MLSLSSTSAGLRLAKIARCQGVISSQIRCASRLTRPRYNTRLFTKKRTYIKPLWFSTSSLPNDKQQKATGTVSNVATTAVPAADIPATKAIATDAAVSETATAPKPLLGVKAKEQPLLGEKTVTTAEQRKADWAIMKEMTKYLWPKVVCPIL